jgi:hypothetical protein
MIGVARIVAAIAVVLAAASAPADVSTAAAPRGERRALSVREANRCWPHGHFKALAQRDRARVDKALAREADGFGSSVAWALLQFERWYVQERNGRIHVYAERPTVNADPEELEAEHRCPNFFGNDDTSLEPMRSEFTRTSRR